MTEPVDAVKTGWRAEVGDLPTPFNEVSINEWLARQKSQHDAGISLAQALIESQRMIKRLEAMLDEQETRIKELELSAAKAIDAPLKADDCTGWMLNLMGRIEALERDARSRQPIGGRR